MSGAAAPKRKGGAGARPQPPAAHTIALGPRRFVVRPAQPRDAAGLLGMLARLSPDDVRLRFFAYRSYFDEAAVAPLLAGDGRDRFVLTALTADEPGEVVGNAMLIRDTGDGAEFALVVRSDCSHAGLGGHLLGRLLAQARAAGIARVYGHVLKENTTMRQLAAEMGFAETPDEEPDCVRVEIATRLGAV